jgi:hypothetical protein
LLLSISNKISVTRVINSIYAMHLDRFVVFLILALLLSACSAKGLQARRAASALVATEAGWQRISLDAGAFVLTAFVPPGLRQTTTLTVYIEGDGLAWINGSTPSLDPTPLNPLALRLALRDPGGAAVYLARPCQFVTDMQRRGCQRKYWTSHRFAPEVIEASSSAIAQLKQRFAAEQLVLVGYSGGGAVAALIAAKRPDVIRLVTVAGNLDHRAWATGLHLSPLDGSLNPADAWQRLQSVPQMHFIGGQDRVMGESVIESYRARFAPGPAPAVRVLPTFDHHCCWVERWPDLLGNAGL